VQGATSNRLQIAPTKTISIHAPVQGATVGNKRDIKRWQFQSTPLCKGRL